MPTDTDHRAARFSVEVPKLSTDKIRIKEAAMWSIFRRKPEKREPTAAKACRKTLAFAHQPKLLALEYEACTRAFAEWMIAVVDADTNAISRRMLLSLYAEFCEVHDRRPMTAGRFDRSLKATGFQRRRLSTIGRPWVYTLTAPGTAIVFKIQPRAAGPIIEPRKVA